MAVNKKMINTVHGHDHNIINELLPQGTIIPRDKSTNGINITEIIIRQNGNWIDTSPNYVVFGGIETRNGIPKEGTLCMFCKEQPAIYSVKKIMSSIKL